MNKFVIAGAAAALFAIPAAANAQAFVQVETGLDSVSAVGESQEGLAYGVSAGYDLPLSGNMFVGIQGTVADSTTKECISNGTDSVCLRTGRDLAVVARLGTSVGDKSKLYVLGGYTNARLRETDDIGGVVTHYAANGDGWRLGAGYQYDINDKIFLKAEYRYSNYEGDFSRHNGLVALGAKF